jgi:hypothetical protein
MYVAGLAPSALREKYVWYLDLRRISWPFRLVGSDGEIRIAIRILAMRWEDNIEVGLTEIGYEDGRLMELPQAQGF